MAKCKTCGTQITGTQLEFTGGGCPGCGQRVCAVCGCTDTAPCVRMEAGEVEPHTCSWPEVITSFLGLPGTFAFFNECTFCYWNRAAKLYEALNKMLEAQEG